jgi:hypothetical protein
MKETGLPLTVKMSRIENRTKGEAKMMTMYTDDTLLGKKADIPLVSGMPKYVDVKVSIM